MNKKSLPYSFLFAILLLLHPFTLSGEATHSYGLKAKSSDFETKIGINKDTINFGIGFSTGKITAPLPFTFKVGTLNCSGSLSKLNSPLLSGIGSPFSSGFSTVSGLTTELPAMTTSGKPISSFAQISYSKRNKIIPKFGINTWYSPETDKIAGSLYFDLNLFSLKFKNSFTTGLFPYTEYSSSSWYMENQYYSEGKQLASNYTGSLEWAQLSFLFSISTYQSPFGHFDNTYKSDIKYAGTNFIITFSGACNPNNRVISSSDQIIKKTLQFRNNIQYKNSIFLKRPLFYKFGLSTFLSTYNDDMECTLKNAAGFQFSYGIVSFSISSTINGMLKEITDHSSEYCFNSCSFNLTNTFAFPLITTSLSLNSSINPSSDYSYTNTKYTGKISVNYSKTPHISVYTNYSVSYKDDSKTSSNITYGFSFDHKVSLFTVSLKVSANMDIY